MDFVDTVIAFGHWLDLKDSWSQGVCLGRDASPAFGRGQLIRSGVRRGVEEFDAWRHEDGLTPRPNEPAGFQICRASLAGCRQTDWDIDPQDLHI